MRNCVYLNVSHSIKLKESVLYSNSFLEIATFSTHGRISLKTNFGVGLNGNNELFGTTEKRRRCVNVQQYNKEPCVNCRVQGINLNREKRNDGAKGELGREGQIFTKVCQSHETKGYKLYT